MTAPRSFPPPTGAGEETGAHSRFPHDYYFLYYGNNYSHPADRLLSQADRLARLWFTVGQQKIFTLCTALFLFPHIATLLDWAGFGARAPSNANKTGSACCKQT